MNSTQRRNTGNTDGRCEASAVNSSAGQTVFDDYAAGVTARPVCVLVVGVPVVVGW